MPSTAAARKHPAQPAQAPVAMPLRDLVHTYLNVRQTERDVGVAEFAEDIADNGLIANLTVFDTGGGKFGVAAGDRRLRALQLLWDQGRIDGNFMVPVLVKPADQARQISLSENIHRVALNPADEFEAFAAIVGELETRVVGSGGRIGLDRPAAIAECARRQAVTVRRVEQSLRLAALAPKIIEALRTGAISLDAAKAYGTYADQALQLKVFEAEDRRTYGEKHNPRAIRYEVRSKTYPSNIAQALYVGLIAYHGAGGRSERELFMGVDEGGDRLLDPGLLDKLAREKAEGDLPALAKRDGFASGLLASGFSTAPPMPKEPAGFGRHYGAAELLSKKDRKPAIGVYSLKMDGSGLELKGAFRPRTAQDPALNPAQRAETPREREERVKRQRVFDEAAHMAVGRFAGTPLEGRAFWPQKDDWVRPITRRPDGKVVVAVLIEVEEAEVEALCAAAEQALAQAEIEHQTEAEAAAAEQAEPLAAEA